MKVENSIKENVISTTQEPIKDTREIIKAICNWNGIDADAFSRIVGHYTEIGTDASGKAIYVKGGRIFDPIKEYLENVYEEKKVVFEKGTDKYFGRLEITESTTRYQLGDKVIEIPYRIKAKNIDTEESITIFPKTSDFIQSWMEKLYIVNNGWAKRQALEKEIMAKLIELAQIRGGNEILGTQTLIEDLQASLKKRGIGLQLSDGVILLDIPRRMLRDAAQKDGEYIAPPIQIKIDFSAGDVYCKGYSPHGFGSPSSRGRPCWGNFENDVRNCVGDCDLKGLVNLLITWSYGYNSADTGTEKEGRHPVAKLRDYINYICDKGEYETPEANEIREHIEQIVQALKSDTERWECSVSMKSFLSKMGAKIDETE